MSAAAPARTRVLRQSLFEAGIILRNGEQLLLTIVLPVLALVAVTRLTWIPLSTPGEHHSRVDLAVPGVMAVAVMSTAFTGQAIATAFDRRYGVLRLLGTTPLGRGGLLTARFLAVLAVAVAQWIVLGALGFALGWVPAGAGVGAAVVVGVLGCWAFLALGLLLGGTVRAEGVLAVANLAWVILTAGGGMLLPPGPGVLGQVVRLLPSGALGDGLRTALIDGALPWSQTLILLAWALVFTLAARRWFRWD